VLLVGPALFDTTLVVISRTRSRRRIYIGGTDHTSHRLVLLGMTSVGATVCLTVATACCSALGVLVAVGAVSAVVIVPVVVIVTVAGLVLMLRIGTYKEDAGRGELVCRPRSQVPPATAVVAPLPEPDVVPASALDGVRREAVENGNASLPSPTRVRQ
jgi:UDP-N-acetylmuramyl pentapeptide phosphotransferase/UDP-N-acetylglucosamine-1-phosphate transferase